MSITGVGREAAIAPSANGTEERARNERTQAVDAAIIAIEKQFGRGSIMLAGSS